MRANSVQTCVTSPPYWGLRDYGVRGQLGLESTVQEYVACVVEIFAEVYRVLKPDGTLWLNLGDSYATGGGKAKQPGGGYRAHDGDSKRPKWAGPYCQPNRMPQPGLKPKDLCMMPARVALALQDWGWYLRSDIIWHKTNPMPESVTDRPTKSHEYLFLLAKNATYYYDADAIKEKCEADTHARYARGRGDVHKLRKSGNVERKVGDGTEGRLNNHLGRNVPWEDDGTGRNKRTVWSIPGVNPKCAAPGSGIKQNSSFSAAVKDIVDFRNKRTVWTLSTKPFKGAHFATFPPKLVEPCILAGSRKGDLVLDPFAGAGTTGLVALEHKRRFLGIELNPEYVAMAEERLGLQRKTRAA